MSDSIDISTDYRFLRKCQFDMSDFSTYWIVINIMVLNTFDQNLSQITTCLGNRPWIAPTKRAIDYQNVSIINPIEVISKPRSADRSYKQQNGVNHGNLFKIDTSNGDFTDRSKTQSLNISVLNVQSACNKVDKISDYIAENKCDIVFLSETWISENNDYTCDQITPRTHTIHHVPRVGKSGGGVAIVTSNSLRAQPSDESKFQIFENAAVRLKLRNENVTLTSVYRPPGYVSEQFFSDFSSLLENYALAKNRLIICGDFNIHVDNKSDKATHKFNSILTDFGLVQHASVPTHLSGHTLDLVITRANDEFMTDTPNTNELFSDHFDVKFHYDLKNNDDGPTFSSFRKLKNIDVEHFKCELAGLNSIDYSAHDLDSLLSVYSTTMQSALDKVAPIRKKRIKTQTLKPWIDEEVKN